MLCGGVNGQREEWINGWMPWMGGQMLGHLHDVQQQQDSSNIYPNEFDSYHASAITKEKKGLPASIQRMEAGRQQGGRRGRFSPQGHNSSSAITNQRQLPALQL